MGIQANSNFVHWNYFIAIEQDLAKLARYIEFSEANFGTYSIELTQLLLAASSEVDVVMKALCNLKKPDVEHKNINHYKRTVCELFPEFSHELCYIHRFGLVLQPWINWSEDQNPIWWQSHNNVKHQRDAHFHEANLKNTLNSVAALWLTIRYYYRELLSQEYVNSFLDVSRKLQPKAQLLDGVNRFEYDHDIVS